MSLSNSLGLLGRKVGMMRLFTDDGDAVPVTVVDVSNNRVTQIKTQETDGYVALQVTFGSRKASRVTKPEAGHLAKAGVEAGEIIQEFRVTADTAGQHKAGGVIAAASVFGMAEHLWNAYEITRDFHSNPPINTLRSFQASALATGFSSRKRGWKLTTNSLVPPSRLT